MATQLHIYMNNPTEGATDGTEVSSGTELVPIEVTLDASKAEEKAVKLAVRCDTGYEIEGATTVSFTGGTGATIDRWRVAHDDNFADAAAALASATWETAITIGNVAATNKVFWVKASCDTTETPSNDRSVDVFATGLVVATEE